jgi:intein/homing endonuclease
MILTIDQNPSVTDEILFTFNTKDVNNKTIDPYKVDALKIYFIERDFASTDNKEYSAESYYNHDYIQGEIHKAITSGGGSAEKVIKFMTEHSPIINGTLSGTIFKDLNIVNTFTLDKKNRFILTNIRTGGISPEFKVNCGSVNLDTGEISLTWNKDPGSYKIIINYEYKMPNGNDFFYYKEATPVEIVGSEIFPAWLSTDQEKSLIVKDNCSEGLFNYTWNPSGRREGDYFICYTWTPYAGASSLSSHERFYLNGSTILNTSIPSHQTVPGKYEELLDRYLPEMFKTLIADEDRTPDVLDNFNKSVAKGFTFLEDLTNQIVDLFDANVINESLLSYLGNTLDLKLKSSDPTLWRRQIKEAVPLFKKKGSIQAMRESFSQAGMKLLRLVNFWQIKSPYFHIDSFFYTPEMKESFVLSKKILLNPVGQNYLPDLFLIKSTSKVEISLNFNESVEISTDNPLQLNWTSTQHKLEADDIIRFEYYHKEPINEKERNLERYIKLLPLADDREEYNILKDSQVFRQYPLKNWNVRLIREDDPLIDSILVERHPFHEDLVFGKVRTEFPYSENVYNMEEYNGCCVGSTLVVTENGIKKIKDIKDDKFIMTEFGFKSFQELKNQGKKETFKITTNLGRSISVTSNHKFKVLSESGLDWKESSQLATGDYVLCKKGNCNSIPKNKGFDKDLWYLAGHLYGDGNLYQKNNNLRHFRWLVSEREPEIKELISKILEDNNAKFQIFCIDKIKHQAHTNLKCNEDLYRISSSSVAVPVLDKLIPEYKTKGRWRKSLPTLIWQSGEEQICSFLRGIFDTDGGIQKRQPLLTTKWKNLAQEIQNLLLIIGIVSSVTSYEASWKGRKRKYFRVRILGKNSRNLFANKIGFNSSTKNKSLFDAIKLEEGSILEADRTIIPFGNKIIKNIFPYRKKISKTKASDRTREEKRVITLITRLKQGYQKTIPDNIVFEIYQKIQHFKINSLESKFIEDYINNDWFFEKIKDISPGSYEYVFDPLNVKDTSSYISNGIVSHNSTRDSSNPCDIDKDFIDPCSYCRSGKFDVDLEIENLSSDRLLEVKDIVTENAPFHSVLKTINIFGNNSEFVTPPLEEYEILITHNYLESSVAGGATLFNRNKFLENVVGRSDLTTKSFVKTELINFYNKDKVLFCPDVNFSSLSVGEDCYIEVFSSINSGVYGVVDGNKNQINVDDRRDLLMEPINNSPFIFDIYNEIFSSNASLERSDVIELEDTSVNFNNLEDIHKIKLTINNQDHYFDLIKIMNQNKLLLNNNNLIINGNLSSNYRIVNSLNQEIIIKGTSKISRCNIKYTNNSKVVFDENIPNKTILKNYNNFLSFNSGSTENLCKVTSIEENYVYITGFYGANLGGIQVKFRQNLAEKKSGYFGYNGIVAKISGDLKGELNIKNEDEEATSEDSFKEDYALYVNSNGNYYFISEINYYEGIDTTVMSLSGVFDNFGTQDTSGIQNDVSIYKYTKNSSTIVDDYTMKEVELKINRTSNEIIEKFDKQTLSTQANSKNGPADFSEQSENIQIIITNLDGTKERKEL